MKKTILSIIGIVAFGLSISAQNTIIDQSNTRDGEAVEYCLQHKKHAELMQNPAYVQALAQDEIIRVQEALENQNSTTKATVWYIPIVFHVLHDEGSENISDAQIIDALAVLNRDFKRENADANSVHPDFQGMPTDVDIEFVFATKSPDGSCFTGITRTQDVLTHDGSNGGDQVDAIVDGNDVFQGQWPPNKYCNVYICGEIGGAAGYTFTPSGWSGSSMFYNGIFVLDTYLGSIGTSNVGTSRTLTHEMGHWLNLSHVWGPNNNPGNASSCSDDDDVTDTPNEIGVTSCNLNEMSCGPRANVENYMDYSYCSKMFTQGQVNRMRSALNSSNSGRNNLKTTANLIATGADGNLYLCKANFEADKTTVCPGSVIHFTDNSYNAAIGWTWSFPGGSPASSTNQNPSVTYNTPGIYQVTLTATDGSTTDVEVKTAYIRVSPTSSTLPFLEGFESYSTLSNIDAWEVNNEGGEGFVLVTNAAHTGSKSVQLANNNETPGSMDELVSAPVDLSGISSAVTLSFRYAYKRKNTSDNDWFRVYATDDCGQSWALRKTLHGFQLSDQTQSTSFTPTSQADWTTVHMTNITSSFWVNNFKYKFTFEAGGGNNIYIDDINIYSGAPSDDLISPNAGLTQGSLDAGLNVYPNPTDGSLTIRFNLEGDEDATIQIHDLTGKVAQQNSINAKAGSNLVLVDTGNLSAGLYFVKLRTTNAQQTVQVVVK